MANNGLSDDHPQPRLKSVLIISGVDAGVVDEIADHERTIAHIEAEIENLMISVRRLQFQKLQHQDQLKQCKGMITLARRIPPEVLATIFEECVSEGWTRTPLMVSHVCSEWRKAASIPTVWSHVYINCDARDPCGRTRFWLGKAQNSRLRITIDVRNDASHLPGIMELLLEKMNQWRFLSVNSALLWQSNYILRLCNRPAPELCVVDVSVVQEFDDVDDHQVEGQWHDVFGLVGSFPKAPQFSTLRITRSTLPSHNTIPSYITNLSITLPWYPTMARLSVSDLLRLLEGLPQLQIFSLALIHGQGREFESPLDGARIVNLPDLEALLLIGSGDLFSVLAHIITPKLTRLQLRSSVDPLGYPDDRTGNYIKQFIERGSPQVELFELHDIDLPSNAFSSCFAGLPHLRELRLHESDISDSIIHQFHGPRGVCPFLNRLDLRWCGQVTGHALVDLVQSRFRSAHNNGNAPSAASLIDVITVINCSFVEESDIIELAQCTICRVVSQVHDYCRSFGCCNNDRYRRRLKAHDMFRVKQSSPQNKRGRLVLEA